MCYSGVMASSFPPDTYVVFAGTVSHQRQTLEQATELADNLARYGLVEVDRFFWVDDPDEGLVKNSETVLIINGRDV